MKYLMLGCFTFMLGAGAVNRQDDPKRAMPAICLWEPGTEADRCWDGTHFIYLMPGYRVVPMEGGSYLVGWPK